MCSLILGWFDVNFTYFVRVVLGLSLNSQINFGESIASRPVKLVELGQL